MNDVNATAEEHKKIGEYFVCSPGAIKNALIKQISLLEDKKGRHLIGDILMNMGAIDQDELDNALQKQRAFRLSQCPVFSTLTATELNALSKRFHEVTVSPFEEFILEGDEDPTMYILASGKAEVYHIDINGKKTIFATLGPGDPIGEMAYFSGGRRTATVRAIERTELINAHYKDLTFYFENAPKVAHAFMQLVESRRKGLEQNK